MNIDSSSRWGVAYLHPLHLCVKLITRSCYTERLLEGGQNIWKPELSQPDEFHKQVWTVESLFSPQQSNHATNGWEEVEIYKESCSAWSHHLLQQQLWFQQFVYPGLAIAPKMGTGTPADAQVKRLWQGILTSVRRPLAVLSAKMDAKVMAGRGHPAQWSSRATSPGLGLAAVNTWRKNSSETQWRSKTKRWTGLVMHGKYSHPQGFLHSRGDDPSLRRHWPQRAFHKQLSGDLKPGFPLLWGRTKQRCILIVTLGGRKELNTVTFISCVWPMLSLHVFN